ncbi:DHHC palmitoyltransferase-domain-containing protein [Scheffersomyces xylosifermentans]|uniref:DHHC palmitoyltransferase-domain-containing protein n=1 Tax=Scheffersomyces xylosifermentans TaxID=1304137 RepID=UPI00315D1D16
MLISHPSILFKQRPWLLSYENFCCYLATLFPKVFFTSVLAWSLYVLLAVVSHRYIRNQYGHPILALVVSVISISSSVLCAYTYFKVIAVGPGSPLDYEILKIKDIQQLNKPQKQYQPANPFETAGDSSTGLLSDAEPVAPQSEPESPPTEYLQMHTMKASAYRYCNKCSVWKPDRAHHCSSSGKCILRMDHYCPWFSTCIGFFNQKFFVQFLFYLAVYAGFSFFLSTTILWKILASAEYEQDFLSINLVILFVVSLAFFFVLGGFTLFQIYMVLKNMTTIEFQEFRWDNHDKKKGSFQYEFDDRGKQKALAHIYDLGYKKNWTSVMGNNWVEWLLPITVTSRSIEDRYNNGINFEINEDAYERWCYNAQLQDQLNQQLADYKRRARLEREEYTAV